MSAHAGPEPGPAASAGTNSFPDVNAVLQGRAFESKFDRDVFFLRRIQESYSAHWPGLLSANIVLTDYVQAPDKLLRFVDELGTAMADTDDLATITNLAAITSDPAFYANTNAYRPGILQSATWALIRIGPRGRQALAGSFTENHYRVDPASLEVLADAIGRAGVGDSKLTAALSATAFTFTAINGGSYPRCTQELTRNLLRLPDGTLAVAAHLNGKQVLEDPGRFQAVVDGIAAARAVGLTTNLLELASQVGTKLGTPGAPPSAYRDDLLGLQTRLRKAIEQLRGGG